MVFSRIWTFSNLLCKNQTLNLFLFQQPCLRRVLRDRYRTQKQWCGEGDTNSLSASCSSSVVRTGDQTPVVLSRSTASHCVGTCRTRHCCCLWETRPRKSWERCWPSMDWTGKTLTTSVSFRYDRLSGTMNCSDRSMLSIGLLYYLLKFWAPLPMLLVEAIAPPWACTAWIIFSYLGNGSCKTNLVTKGYLYWEFLIKFSCIIEYLHN